MIRKRLDDVTQIDLERLVANAVAESVSLEYKRTLELRLDSVKDSFLQHVCAFANTAGGDLVYGVEERDSVAVGVPGVEHADVDETIRALSDAIRNGLDTRLAPSSFDIRAIALDSGRYVVVVRVQRSLERPHMVRRGGVNRYYGRGAKNKYPLGASEIRALVLESQDAVERVHRWRSLRIDGIEYGESPIGSVAAPVLVVHLTPLAARAGIDLGRPGTRDELVDIGAPSWSGLDPRPTFDGYLVPSFDRTSGCTSYTLWFHNAAVECATVLRVRDLNTDPALNGRRIEELIDRCLRLTTRGYVACGVHPPILLLVTLLEMRGVTIQPFGVELAVNGRPRPVDRDRLEVPPTLIEELPSQSTVRRLLRPVYDRIWQATGLVTSPLER